MPPWVALFRRNVVAAAFTALLLPAGAAPPSATPTSPTLPSRLEQHALMLAAAARSSPPTEAPEQAARYIETALAAQGYAVSRHDERQYDHLLRQVEITLSHPAPAPPTTRVLIVGAAYAPATRRNDTDMATVIELARLLKNLPLATGTQLKFVFSVNPNALRTGNFIAFAGSRGSAELVRKTLASFRPAPSAEGLATPAFVEGVTLIGRAGTTLLITDIALLRYPYSHTLQGAHDPADFATMARGVSDLARLIATLAGPAAM